MYICILLVNTHVKQIIRRSLYTYRWKLQILYNA